MRALIVSDIHSNIDALEAVLEMAPPHDVVWNLGDVVGYGASPNAVIERVRQIGTVFVRGNHDRACCGMTSAEHFNPIALNAVRWTQRQLTEDGLEWLRQIPRGPIMPDGPQVSCVHGSPLDEDQYLLSTRDAWQQIDHTKTRLTFFGHTHVQGGFGATAEGEWFPLKPVYSQDQEIETYDLDLRETATYLVNPGSVGQPRDRDWRAACAVYDDATHRLTFCRMPYDVRIAQMRIQRAGLPDVLGSRLRSGR